MKALPDDPIVASMERTGYPSWMQDEDEDDYRFVPLAVYDPD